jgi:DNA-binding SARP family transcriptional activator/tetratricopeptide (TPR) repeat protein
MYTLRLFGSPVLAGPDGPVTGRVAQERKLALLAVLALAEGRSLTRDSLAAMFWPETEPARARQNVADGLWVIRSALGDEALATRGNQVSLSSGVVATDVEAFHEALQAGELEEAVGAYTGPFMDGFHISGAPAFERWVDGKRAHLADAHAVALERLVQTAREEGDAVQAVTWARHLVSADPLNTRRALLLMEVLAASGDVAGALRHGEAHGELLSAELGLAAPPEVEARIRELRTSPPPVAPPGRAAAPDRPAPGSSGSPGPPSSAPAGGSPPPVPAPGAPSVPVSPAPSTSAPPSSRAHSPRGSRVRYASLAAGVSLAGVVAAWLIPGVTSGDAPETVPDRIVVASFENRTGDPELDLVGRMAADALVRGFTEARIGEVVLPAELMGTGVGTEGGRHGPDQAREVAQLEGAGIAVSGTVDPRPGGPVLTTTIATGPDGRVLAVLDQPLGPAGIVAAMERLTSRAVGSVAAHLGHDAPELPFVVWTPSYESYRTADRATNLFLQRRYIEAASLFREAYDLDPTAVGYLLWEGVSRFNREDYPRVAAILDEIRPRKGELGQFDATQFDWLESRLLGDWEGALQACRRAHRIHPHSGVGGFQLGRELLRSGHPGEALEVLLALDPDRGWLAGWPFYWSHLSGAYHFLGRHEEELAAIEEGYRRHGGPLLTARLRALAALGRIEAVNGAIRESTNPPQHALVAARALHRHGYPEAAKEVAEDGLRTLRAAPPLPEAFPVALRPRMNLEARLLMTAGHLSEARGAFLELLAGSPTDRDLLGWTGVVEARLGMEGEARGRIRTLESLEGAPYTFGGYTVARAAIHAELGDDPARVRLLLEQARQEGWPLDYFHFIPLFDPVRDHPDVRGFFELPR